MRKPNLTRIVLILGGLVLLICAAYWSPPVQEKLAWRVDFALTYLRAWAQPVEAMPTSLPQPRLRITSRPTQILTTPEPTNTVTPGPTPSPTPSPTPIPEVVSLPAPAFEKQDINACGPASLAMYLRVYGWKGTQADISSVLKPLREDRNVNVDELAYYMRTHVGWLNVEYRVGGTLELLKRLLAAGFPVIIEEGFKLDQSYWPNDDLWGAHYLLLTGYDDHAENFTIQDSFYGANKKATYPATDTSWQAFNRVYFLVYPPEQEAAIKAILGKDWDADANRQRALETAEAETKSQPENAYAWFNLGSNLVYFERYAEASDAYDQARNLGLPQRMLRYQFGPFIAYFHSGQIDDLLTMTEYSLKITRNSEEALLWHGWAVYRKGDLNQAVLDWRAALKAHPGYPDAEYALKFVGATP